MIALSEQKKTVSRGTLYFVDSFFSLLRQGENGELPFPQEMKLTAETNMRILFN